MWTRLTRRAALGTGLATLFAPDGTGKTGQSAVDVELYLTRLYYEILLLE
jgi:hypothetical protein